MKTLSVWLAVCLGFWPVLARAEDAPVRVEATEGGAIVAVDLSMWGKIGQWFSTNWKGLGTGAVLGALIVWGLDEYQDHETRNSKDSHETRDSEVSINIGGDVVVDDESTFEIIIYQNRN